MEWIENEKCRKNVKEKKLKEKIEEMRKRESETGEMKRSKFKIVEGQEGIAV